MLIIFPFVWPLVVVVVVDVDVLAFCGRLIGASQDESDMLEWIAFYSTSSGGGAKFRRIASTSEDRKENRGHST